MDTATATPLLDTAPAPVEKAAPKEERGAFGRDVIVRDYEDPAASPPPETPTTEDSVDAADEAAPPPPAEVKPPARLAEFRKADGRFDEDRLEPVLTSAKQIQAGWNDFNSLIARHPELEAGILRAMKAEGRTLDADAEARLAKAAPPPQPVKVETPADVKTLGLELARKHQKDYEATRLQDGEAAAAYYWMQNVQTPYYEALLESKEAAKAAAQKADAEKAEQTRRKEYGTTKVREQVAECAKAYPTIYKLDPSLPFGGDFIDADVAAEVTKLRAAMEGPLTLMELTDLALYRLKRQKPPVPVKKASEGLPPVIARRAQAAPAAAPDRGMFGRTVIVKNG